MHPPHPSGGQYQAPPWPHHGSGAYGTGRPGNPPVQPEQEPSGVTAWAAALLGCVVAFGIPAGLTFGLTMGSLWSARALGGLLLVVVTLSLPVLVGAVGILSRRPFGRWVLTAGLVLPMCGFGFVLANGVLLWSLCGFVLSAATVVLALSPTTGAYLRTDGGTHQVAVPQGAPVPPGGVPPGSAPGWGQPSGPPRGGPR
ncbi:hypothetical protein [Actinopolyspora mortivallis]|uniref:Uncharacterized protein n=1 Tax=Actinopolyspora mortivallis TaxID=33906 RepID=A0A2T0H0N5_ACTMO|nr:hypothetical protein [Actinopolyspora mortivallis]PRW64921.1 hypothetical protein CEP50_03685 [Actinopolyspora mortivallis]